MNHATLHAPPVPPGRFGRRSAQFGARSFFGEPHSRTQGAVPLFRFDCGIGCPPFLPIMCQAVVRQAILDACRLAVNAARKLAATPRDTNTVQQFKAIFGHDPARPEPWPGIKDAGIRIANRYRLVEKALLRANTLYRCDPCTQTVYERPEGFVLDLHARALPPNEVRLCPSFWQLSRILQAGVILHEMFHLRFDPCFVHGACETKRTSAYCYEVFALRMASETPDALAVSKCSASTLRP